MSYMIQQKKKEDPLEIIKNEQKPLIKGGYYIAPSSPAEPRISGSMIWGTAIPTMSPASRQEYPSSSRTREATHSALNDKSRE